MGRAVGELKRHFRDELGAAHSYKQVVRLRTSSRVRASGSPNMLYLHTNRKSPPKPVGERSAGYGSYCSAALKNFSRISTVFFAFQSLRRKLGLAR